MGLFMISQVKVTLKGASRRAGHSVKCPLQVGQARSHTCMIRAHSATKVADTCIQWQIPNVGPSGSGKLLHVTNGA